MAPIGESYFPPLDRCFNGEHQLLSWKTTYIALSQLGDEADNASLRRHLTDPQSIELLVGALDPYSTPTAQTKSSFETKTSAINVTPSTRTGYDIKQIQDDTIWLSKETNINEVSALRIAVLEWQTRSTTQLLNGDPADSNRNPIATNSSILLQGPKFGPGFSILANSASTGKDASISFNDTSHRRRRLWDIYLAERRYILKTGEYLLSALACKERDRSDKHASRNKDRSSIWMEEVGESVLAVWNARERSNIGRKDFILEAIDAIGSRIDGLQKGSEISGIGDVEEDTELAWVKNQLLEMIHIMQILLVLMESSTDVRTSPTLLSWFRLMNKYNFLENFQLPYPKLQETYVLPLQSLIALVSLTMLSICATLDLLVQSEALGIGQAQTADTTPYILDSATVNEVNDIFHDSASLGISSPAVLAWSVITFRLRDLAEQSRERRETRQSQRAADKYGAIDSSDTEGERGSGRGFSNSRRRSSTGSDTSQQSTLLEEISDTIASALRSGLDDPILLLAKSSIGDGRVFDVITALAVDYCTQFGFEHHGVPGRKQRGILLELISACVDFVDYSALITVTIAVLTGSERYWEMLDRPSISHRTDSIVNKKFLEQRIWLTALSRFPYESLPFLQLCRALAFQHSSQSGIMPALWTNLEELNVFTCAMPISFGDYKPIREDEEPEYIQLTGVLSHAVSPAPAAISNGTRTVKPAPRSTRSSQNSMIYQLPPGTQGRIISDAKPFVVHWNHDYSSLTYIGRLLQNVSTTGLPGVDPDSCLVKETIGEVISLFTVLLSSAVKSSPTGLESSTALESAQSILGQASDSLDRNQDIVSIILDIFEHELYRPHATSENGNSVELLVQCARFIYALLAIMPDRVWPFLGRSGLLGINKDGSQLSTIIDTEEMVTGHYDFLITCIRLFDALIEDAVIHAVSRKAPTKAIARFGKANKLGTGISGLAMEKVLLKFLRAMTDVFESTINWKFAIPAERLEINGRLCSIFEKILTYCYGVNDHPEVFDKLTSPIAPAAEYILDVFLSNSNNKTILLPLLDMFAEGLVTPSTSLPVQALHFWVLQTKAALNLTTTLIRVNALLRGAPSHLEESVFAAAPVLSKVYAAHESYRLPVVEMFDVLIRSAANTEGQPPSLLGHLGQANSSFFLEVLSMLDRPLNDNTLFIAIWRLLSAAVSQRQPWFAIYILTGNSPRVSLRGRQETDSSDVRRAEPMLESALDALASIDKLEPRKALAMLEFVALSADFWPWVLNIIEQHPKFLTAISESAARTGSLILSTRHGSHEASVDYNNIQIASFVADILAMYGHHTQQTGNTRFARMLVPHLGYLIKNAISIPSYNTSLHGNLRQNFSVRFPGSTLADFKRTKIMRAPLGESFYYDLDLANKMLSYEPAWVGIKGPGFAEEFKRANLNLSVVEAQVNLFHSWKSLLLELSGPLGSEARFQKIMARAVTDCLQANAENILPEVIFERLSQSRAEFAFTLLQRLVEVKSTEVEVKNILLVAWNTLRTHNPDLGSALERDDAAYYRMLLKILYLALQVHAIVDNSSTSNKLNALQGNDQAAEVWSTIDKSTIQVGLEVIATIVARGFRSLTMLLHESSSLIRPADFALLTALLRSCLRLPHLNRYTSHLLTAFSDSETSRCASTLLSWSDQLATSTSGDPVYGELSALFLLELSSTPTLAESLAVEGVLQQVLSTNLINVLQSRQFGPSDQPSRMYTIWARAILPLFLNLLHAVGPPMAAEIAVTLNQFPHQLNRASNAFALNSRSNGLTVGYITTSMSSEAHTLALIVSILRTFREAGASAGIIASEVEEVKWDDEQVKEDLEGLLQRRATLRERLVPVGEREESLLRSKPLREREGSENRLEEKVLEDLRSVIGVLGGTTEE